MRVSSFVRLNMNRFVFVLGVTVWACAAGCAADPETTDSTEAASVVDATSLTARSDGKFDAVCRDGHREIVTVEQIRLNQVCTPVMIPPARRIVHGDDRNFDIPNSASNVVL